MQGHPDLRLVQVSSCEWCDTEGNRPVMRPTRKCPIADRCRECLRLKPARNREWTPMTTTASGLQVDDITLGSGTTVGASRQISTK